MSLTANRDLPHFVDQELRALQVKAATHIYRGALVGIDRSSGYARMLAAGDLFAGVAYEEADNAGANGEKTCRVYSSGDFLFDLSGVTIAAVGRPVFAQNEEALSLSPSLNGSYVGTCIDVPAAGQAAVRIEPFWASQDLKTASATLASSTSAATTNPVLITQRPIVVTSIQVCFNTKPDVGTLDVGFGNVTPNELVAGANLALLTNNTPNSMTLSGSAAVASARIWAKVGQATSTAGVGGLLTMRYFELP